LIFCRLHSVISKKLRHWIKPAPDNIDLGLYINRDAGHEAQMGEKRNVYSLLVRKPEGKRPLGRPRHRWIDNIKKDLLEIGLSVVDWIGLAQDKYRWRALVNSVMNLRVP
jgi:hypothetical protein